MVSLEGGALHESGRDKSAVSIKLFGGPYVVIGGERLEIPEGSKRLVAFAAIHRGRLERRYVAGSLWQCVDDIRAAGNLRSALWRLRGAGIDVVEADKWSLQLVDHISIDLEDAVGWAERVVHNVPGDGDLDNIDDRARALDILPGFYDDWAITARERIRQRTLHALELVSRMLTKWGRSGEAVQAAMLAVHAEPLRESAQRALIDAHLGEGNLIEARRSYSLYEKLLMRELAVSPPSSMAATVRLPAPRAFTAQRTAQMGPPAVAAAGATSARGALVGLRGTQLQTRVGRL
jgi:DNA-binding SARP family transcriptional activator